MPHELHDNRCEKFKIFEHTHKLFVADICAYVQEIQTLYVII